MSLAELARVLRVDQRQRWQAGQHVPAEDYLRRHPALSADTEAVLDLIFHEFLLPFEVTSILILIAIMGAVVLASKPTVAGSPPQKVKD